LAAVKKNVRERVLDAALQLFAQYGYFGVTIRDLAERAGTNLHGVYRAFGDKDGAFDAVLHRILGASLPPARLALLVLEGRKKQEARSLIQAAAQEWYESLSVEGARILLYAYLSGNRRWEKPSSDYLSQISEVLARSMEVQSAGPRQDFNPTISAKTLVLSLFVFKVIEAPSKSKSEQAEAVAGILKQSLKGLA